MLGSLSIFAKPTEIHSLRVLERIKSQPTDEVKIAFVNMGVLFNS